MSLMRGGDRLSWSDSGHMELGQSICHTSSSGYCFVIVRLNFFRHLGDYRSLLTARPTLIADIVNLPFKMTVHLNLS